MVFAPGRPRPIAMLLFLMLASTSARAQQRASYASVVDEDGVPVAGAAVLDANSAVIGTTDAQGRFVLREAEQITITAACCEPAKVQVRSDGAHRIVLAKRREEITVTAYRSPLTLLDSPVNTRILDQRELREAAAPGLDGKLRQTPGLELFRHSSSLVANPTSQGISLRGLGSTAASRTLVLNDDVPLNDPYGGWIHWEEIPELALSSVEVMRGGGSDLYGSSAIGGVINVMTAVPRQNSFDLITSCGSLGTTDNAMLGSLKRGAWGGIVAADILNTDGYILVAPDARGPIDAPYDMHSQDGRVDLERSFRDSDRIFLRGNVLNEARDNGTPFQKNGLRLWRYATGTDWEGVALRFYGSTEHYRQTFSAIAPGRVTETPTRYAEDPADELGAAAHWRKPILTNAVLLVGADTHDVRASDDELAYPTQATQNTTGRQRQTGIYGEVLATPSRWTLNASGRIDHFSNFDALQWQGAAPISLPSFSQTVFDPRAGVSYRAMKNVALHVSGFRAFRAPSLNELYRTGQVGQQTTLANPNLRSERATGWETGFQANVPQWDGMLRVSYFWTQVNRPITALTLQTTATVTLLQRENLGQIESRGVSVDYEAHPVVWASVSGGYQFADATVTNYAQQPQLVGNWIPQVARNMATTQLRVSSMRLGVLSLQGRISGRQFDDDANRYLLHSYFRLDTYASRRFGRRFEIFAAGENLFDRSIEVGKTPVLTLGTPRTVRAGLRFHWGE